MGFRLSKIYTRTGDQGQTHAAGGRRVDKFSLEIQALGEVDELNSHVGLAAVHIESANIQKELYAIQHQLFDIGAEISMAQGGLIQAQHIEALEQMLEHHNEALEPLKEFILPGGSPAGCQVHVCRSVARRAERCLHQLKHQCGNDELDGSCRYLNRLSDYFFVLARVCNRQAQIADVLWRNPRKSKNQTEQDHGE